MTVRPYAPLSVLLLALPYGMAAGYVTVTLAWQARASGLPVESVATLAALYFFPNTWKVLLAPLVDVTFSARGWYAGSVLVAAMVLGGCAVLATMPPDLPLLEAAVVALALAASVSHIALPRIIAHVTPPERLGAIGGWLNVGGLGGSGLGGGLALLIAQRAPAWAPALTLAVASLACVVPVFMLPSPPPEPGPLGRAFRGLAHDLWTLARARSGALALLICLLPLAGGALGSLWSAVAEDWRVSPDALALVNGALGGVIVLPGCLVGGWLCDWLDRKSVYLGAGCALACCAVVMAALPRDQAEFLIWTSVYGVLTGAAYTAFSAVALEAAGGGGAGTKYTLMASLANLPITLGILIDGHAATRFGAGGMLLTDAALGVGGALLYLLVAGMTRRAGARPVVSPA